MESLNTKIEMKHQYNDKLLSSQKTSMSSISIVQTSLNNCMLLHFQKCAKPHMPPCTTCAAHICSLCIFCHLTSSPYVFFNPNRNLQQPSSPILWLWEPQPAAATISLQCCFSSQTHHPTASLPASLRTPL